MADELETPDVVEEAPKAKSPMKAKIEKVAADKAATEALQTGELSLVGNTDGHKAPMCKAHPKKEAPLYGMCMECYEKIPLVKKRELYLKARLSGVNTHNYPATMIKAWKQELVFIASGIWKGPMKVNSKSKLVGEIVG